MSFEKKKKKIQFHPKENTWTLIYELKIEKSILEIYFK